MLCFVQLINAASAAPRSKNPLFWMSKGCCNRECLNLKDTSVFHFCLLVLLQRIYYIFNQSPQSLNSPSLVSTINISIIVEKLLLHGYSFFFFKGKIKSTLLSEPCEKMIYYNEITAISSGIIFRSRFCFLLPMEIYNGGKHRLLNS